ncbi:hypothetical protein H9Q72_004051 [Fusarium xylarioides]|uniref:PiggyBac transposable element-derived protein domain-containing protein n=1 Tax=Fusarium xylarioides TaxID=221167 RepID=A0A9P7I5G3_9HYPO|nr:hypothetical protein H9Q72_004051 [Fusarium xylarioides]
MICFKGRSLVKVTIKNKPIPEGLKIWAAAKKGYLLRWEYHIPEAAQTRERRRLIAARRHADPHNLAETQRVMLNLAVSLPPAAYHIFFDNLFTTPSLIRALRERGIAATGTAHTNHGIYHDFIIAKQANREGQLQKWDFNKLQAVPSEDDLVNHIAFQDNCLVLWMTSYFSGSERVQHLRRRLNTMQAQAREARAFFSPDFGRVINTPCIQIAYNFNMNGVDRGDQLCAYRGYAHRIRRGGWQALAWTFLLDMILRP